MHSFPDTTGYAVIILFLRKLFVFPTAEPMVFRSDYSNKLKDQMEIPIGPLYNEGGPGQMPWRMKRKKFIYIKKVTVLCLIITIQENCEEIVFNYEKNCE